ncbi:phosphatidylserine decarboxylase [Hymenopellis radicata]|nr:phosphatidylserine decarboxylase [Hymenopellis radicata]
MSTSRAHLALSDHFRRAGWLPASPAALEEWLKDVVKDINSSARQRKGLLPVIEQFKTLIETNSELYMGFHRMFEEQSPLSKYVDSYMVLLKIFNKIIQEAPFYGEIGPPIYMVLHQAMNTQGGFTAFLDETLNQQFKAMFDVWAAFLDSPASCYVLTAAPGGWFSSPALASMTEHFPGLSFAEVFECDPSVEFHGFTSWDDFFNRTFREGIRPLEFPENPDIINAACESQLYNIARDVQERDTFWLKGEPYSLIHMLNNDEYAPQFVGGTVFQGFLQVTGYHRWQSPVAGTVKKIVTVPGTYFAQSPAVIGQDDNPYLRSLSFITAITTRMLIFIESENPLIGLMCFVALGMTEVSTCEATVQEGDCIKRGEELGMFHFGGSSHALVFRPETKIQFFDGFNTPGDQITVRAAIAGVSQ